MHEDFVDYWQKNVIESASWILFRNGTCVIADAVSANSNAEVARRFGELGPISTNTKMMFLSSRDFAIIDLAKLTILVPVRVAFEKPYRQVGERSPEESTRLLTEIEERAEKRRKQVVETFNADASSLAVVHVQIGRSS